MAQTGPTAVPPDLDPFRVTDTAVYTDPEVFELEKEHLFARNNWIFACHESDIPQTGSFYTFELAGNQLLLARGEDEQLRGFYNVCRHRGAQLVDESKGQTHQFRCPYHWWTYNLEGELKNAPAQEAYEYEGSGFDMSCFGLVPVRVDAAHGLVFICLDPHAPSLAEFLGGAVDVLGSVLGHAEYEVFHETHYWIDANWKTFPENSRDGYHAVFLHPFFRKTSTPREYQLLENGHAVQYLGTARGDMDPELFEKLSAHTLPGCEKNDGYALVVFPHLLVFFRNNFVWVESVHPASATLTKMHGRVLAPVGDSVPVRERRLFSWDRWANKQNLYEDVPMLEQQQRGLGAKGVPFVLMNRGTDSATGVRGDDNRLRQFWEQWRKQTGMKRNSLRDDFSPQEAMRELFT